MPAFSFSIFYVRFYLLPPRPLLVFLPPPTPCQWHPERAGVFASGGDDGMIDVIDASKLTADMPSPSPSQQQQQPQATPGSAGAKGPSPSSSSGKKGRPGKGGSASASVPPVASSEGERKGERERERDSGSREDGRHLFKHVGHRSGGAPCGGAAG